jgi:hypothetical protein
MGDLQFNAETRDLVIKNGDFVLETDPSVQNGAIIRDAHCFSIRYPIYGIGLQRLINANISTINYEMNRWIQQVKTDGAKKASFTASITNGVATVENSISYVQS